MKKKNHEVNTKKDNIEILPPEEITASEETDWKFPVGPYDPLQRYLWEIRKYPLLSQEEERELALRYREQQDKEAAYKLITSNLRLVVKIALEFQRFWMRSLLDLIQEGNLGLMQALKKFDPTRGIKFSYYASFWIKAYILKFIMDNWKLVKIGSTQAQRKLFYNLKKEKDRLIALGYVPEARLLAERLDVTEQDVIEMEQRMESSDLSLDAPVSSDSDDELNQFLPDNSVSIEEQLSDMELKDIFMEKLEEFKKELKGKELFILENRLLAENPMTLQEIGDKYGISRERVRQIQNRLLKKIKDYVEKELPDFAEAVMEYLRK